MSRCRQLVVRQPVHGLLLIEQLSRLNESSESKVNRQAPVVEKLSQCRGRVGERRIEYSTESLEILDRHRRQPDSPPNAVQASGNAGTVRVAWYPIARRHLLEDPVQSLMKTRGQRRCVLLSCNSQLRPAGVDRLPDLPERPIYTDLPQQRSVEAQLPADVRKQTHLLRSDRGVTKTAYQHPLSVHEDRMAMEYVVGTQVMANSLEQGRDHQRRTCPRTDLRPRPNSPMSHPPKVGQHRSQARNMAGEAGAQIPVRQMTVQQEVQGRLNDRASLPAALGLGACRACR